MSPLARKLLVAFSLLGLGASIAAAYVHYNLIEHPNYSSFCEISATFSCREAYLSRYGSIAGVPVAIGGIVFFAWVLLMQWAARGKRAISDSAPSYLFAGSTLALAVVLYLAYASFFVLGKVCLLCAATYVAVIGVFVITGGATSVPMSSLPSRLLRDMRVLVATPLALVVALLFVAGASWGMTVFPREAERMAAPPPIQPLTPQQTAELTQWWDVQPKSPAFPFDNNGAKVLIVEFADFQCPHCKQMYFALKPVLDKYTANPKDVTFIFKTWPLNGKCNPSLPGGSFMATCEASAAYVMAKQRGTGDALKDWFFSHQEAITPDWVKKAASDVGKIPDFQGGYDKAIQEVKTDAAVGTSLQVKSTPTFFINGRALPGGGIAPQYFDALIKLELSRAQAQVQAK